MKFGPSIPTENRTVEFIPFPPPINLNANQLASELEEGERKADYLGNSRRN